MVGEDIISGLCGPERSICIELNGVGGRLACNCGLNRCRELKLELSLDGERWACSCGLNRCNELNLELLSDRGRCDIGIIICDSNSTTKCPVFILFGSV